MRRRLVANISALAGNQSYVAQSSAKHKRTNNAHSVKEYIKLSMCALLGIWRFGSMVFIRDYDKESPTW